MCRNTALAKLTCAAIFQPGSYVTGPGAGTASFTLSRGSVLYARGVQRIHASQAEPITFRLDEVRHVRAGRYRLTMRITSRRAHLTIQRSIRVG